MPRLGVVALAAAICSSCVPAASPAPSSPPRVSAAPSADTTASPVAAARALAIREFAVPAGSRPHDVAPAVDGGVWYSGQGNGTLGHLDPASGTVREIRLGNGSAPHGVIVGPDGAPWITDGGLNAIVRVDPTTEDVRVFALPADRPGANLNTAVFDHEGMLWFTGQAGVYGSLEPASGVVTVFDSPDGRGPYGITVTPKGEIWFASLASSHVIRVDRDTGWPTIYELMTADQGARRVWSDSTGRVWVSEWIAGQVAVIDPATGASREWRLPGDTPQAYAVYVDERDIVWLTDFGANAIVRFDPLTERFDSIELPIRDGQVRQLLGRPGEVWGAESAVDKLVLVTEG
jgi:virginiamycin B lyase